MKNGNKTFRISTSGVDGGVHTTAFTPETSLCTAWSILEVFLLLTAIHMNSISAGTMPGWRYQATLNSPSNAIRRESTLTDRR